MSAFKPKKGEKYYMLNSRFEIKHPEYTGSEKAKRRVGAGNSFATLSEVYGFRAKIMQIVNPKKQWWEFWK